MPGHIQFQTKSSETCYNLICQIILVILLSTFIEFHRGEALVRNTCTSEIEHIEKVQLDFEGAKEIRALVIEQSNKKLKVS